MTPPDVCAGLDDPTPEAWSAWHRAMLDEREATLERVGFDPKAYDDPGAAWSDTSFRQVFLFMYDASFWDRDAGRYRTPELVERWRAMFGRVDSVLLWHAYPRLGFDRRTQFDFYRDMPGGLAALRAQVSDVFHAQGIRVFVDYNPWDAGTYDDLGEIVAALDADGVMLDTMTDAPDLLEQAVRLRRGGVVLAPELRPRDADLSRLRQSWAQWFEVGDGPSIYRHRWLVPRHRQLAIRRWDPSRRLDIVYSTFCGSGLLLWDNVFGAWNPYSIEDRRLIAETGAIFDRYGDLFAHGAWLPLIPTGVSGLDANRWTDEATGRSIVMLRNRTARPLRWRPPEDARWMAFWGDRDTVEIAPTGIQAVVLDPDADASLRHFDRLSARAGEEVPGYGERGPSPRRVRQRVRTPPAADGMIALPGGELRMRVVHARRECGCHPEGATENALWGWYYEDIITHEMDVTLSPFAIRRTAVTNGEYLTFVTATGYRPADDQAFLKHLRQGGALPASLSEEDAALPVTFVSLADAEAYAAWRGERLPEEAEWQWAAEGAGFGRRYPWGDEERGVRGALGPAVDPESATPQGVMGLSGNAWELTAGERTDGHTRFAILRGGAFLPPGESVWLVARGARPNDSHAKYLLLGDALDRSEAVSFRTVVDLA